MPLFLLISLMPLFLLVGAVRAGARVLHAHAAILICTLAHVDVSRVWDGGDSVGRSWMVRPTSLTAPRDQEWEEIEDCVSERTLLDGARLLRQHIEAGVLHLGLACEFLLEYPVPPAGSLMNDAADHSAHATVSFAFLHTSCKRVASDTVTDTDL